jgi:hypothetical protein
MQLRKGQLSMELYHVSGKGHVQFRLSSRRGPLAASRLGRLPPFLRGLPGFTINSRLEMATATALRIQGGLLMLYLKYYAKWSYYSYS